MEPNAMKVRGGGAERGWPPLTEDPAAAVQAMDHGVDRPFGQGKRGENIGAGTAPRPSAVGAPAGDRAGWEGTGPPLRPLHRALMAAAPPRRPLEQGGARGLPARPRWVREGLEEDQLHGAWRGTSTWWKAPTSGLTPPRSRPAPSCRSARTPKSIFRRSPRARSVARPGRWAQGRRSHRPSPSRPCAAAGACGQGLREPPHVGAFLRFDHPARGPQVPLPARRKRCEAARVLASPPLRLCFAPSAPSSPLPGATRARCAQRTASVRMLPRPPSTTTRGSRPCVDHRHHTLHPARPPLTRPAACVARPRPRHCTRPSPRPAR